MPLPPSMHFLRPARLPRSSSPASTTFCAVSPTQFAATDALFDSSPARPDRAANTLSKPFHISDHSFEKNTNSLLVQDIVATSQAVLLGLRICHGMQHAMSDCPTELPVVLSLAFAAQGVRLHVVNKGVVRLMSGTSASTPVFAGIIALLNAQRLKAGKAPLGFLNPWIYGSGYRGLNDIVHGKSSGCHGTSVYSALKTPVVKGAGWNATVGWDPVTGWGTPDYERLLPLALAV